MIGIGGSLMLDPLEQFKNYYKSYVNEDYVTSVIKAGGIPVILPVVADEEAIRQQLLHVDGIVFSGGLDVDPSVYGESPLEKCEATDLRRDWFDLRLFKIAKELQIPTLCICKGHQIASVAMGGNLYQDLSYYPTKTLVHNQNSEPNFKAHKISIKKDSLLYEVLGKENIMVNSFHHQMLKDIPKDYQVTATAEDGIVEAIEYVDKNYFFLSLQWHPEMMAAKNDEDMLKLFHRLIQEANKS